jgi:hypothetical protein
MWPLRIENPEYLQEIYGNYPDISSVEVTRAEFKRDGAALRLSFISKSLPYKPPAKWGRFNAAIFDLQFFPIKSLSLRRFDSNGASSLRMWDEEGAILLTCAVRLSLTCLYMRIDRISGLLKEPGS